MRVLNATSLTNGSGAWGPSSQIRCGDNNSSPNTFSFRVFRAQAAGMKLQKHASSSDQEQYQHDRACFRQFWKTGDEKVFGKCG